MLLRQLGSAETDAERARWRVVRLDTMQPLEGEIMEADIDSGVATMRERGPDKVDDSGKVVPTWQTVVHSIGAGGIAIVRR